MGDSMCTIAIASCTNATASPVATSKITVPTGWEGYIDVNKCFGICTTLVANTTTEGTILLKKGSTTIGTLTMTDATAVGAALLFVPATGYENGVSLAAADVVSCYTTLGTGGTAAGAFTVYYRLSLAPLAR